MECRTDADFEKFSTALSALIVSKHAKHPLYAKFMLKFARDVCAPLRDVDTRKTASALTTLSNEQQKAAKDALAGSKKKSKGAAKPGLAKVGCRADVGTYEESLDDSGEYDDFVSTLYSSPHQSAELYPRPDVNESLSQSQLFFFAFWVARFVTITRCNTIDCHRNRCNSRPDVEGQFRFAFSRFRLTQHVNPPPPSSKPPHNTPPLPCIGQGTTIHLHDRNSSRSETAHSAKEPQQASTAPARRRIAHGELHPRRRAWRAGHQQVIDCG